MFGFGGYLAAWSGYWVPVDANDYGTTSMFSLLNTVDGNPHTWVTVVVACLSVIMSESAVDSLQVLSLTPQWIPLKAGPRWAGQAVCTRWCNQPT